jgi:mono/diheme cytochrome c family protein
VRKSLFAVAALGLAWVMLSSAGGASRAQTPAATPGDQNLGAFEGMLTQYCVTCHNERLQMPAGAPLVLDVATLADPGADAETWERVVRKLGVGAMPPAGSPTPGEAELDRFRSVLAAHLDASASQRRNPGRYVLPCSKSVEERSIGTGHSRLLASACCSRSLSFPARNFWYSLT